MILLGSALHTEIILLNYITNISPTIGQNVNVIFSHAVYLCYSKAKVPALRF